MAAIQHDLYIEQNATFQQNIYWYTDTQPPKLVDVTGYTAKMQIKPTAASATIYQTLTTANGMITVGGTNGLITLLIPAATTLTYTWATAVYDLEVVAPNGFSTRLLQGNVTVNPAVTTI